MSQIDPNEHYVKLPLITDFFGKVDLKHQIVVHYLRELQKEYKMNEGILIDQMWGNKGSEFDKSGRADLEEVNKLIANQIKVLNGRR